MLELLSTYIYIIATSIASLDSSSLIDGLMSNVITSSPVNATYVNIPAILEYIAVITGCMYGASTAFDRKLDIMGAMTLSLINGFGGGIIRDILIPSTSVYFLDTPSAVVIGLFFGVLIYYFRSLMNLMDKPLQMVDTISMALFAFLGAEKAVAAGYAPISCMILGFITSVGGGFLRDISLGDTPAMFKAGTLYAVAALAGAVIYVTLIEIHVVKIIAVVICVISTVGLRGFSILFNWRTQDPVDYSSHVLKPIKRIFRYEDGSQDLAETSVEAREIYHANPADLLVFDKNAVLVVHEIADTTLAELDSTDDEEDE